MTQIDILNHSYEEFTSQCELDLKKKFSGKHILITGASGLVGGGYVDFFRYLNESILDEPAQLFLQTRKRENLSQRYGKESGSLHFIVGPAQNINAKKSQWDFIIHAASPASPKDYMGAPWETVETNYFTCKALLTSIRQNSCSFLYISSADIYGDPPSQYIPTPETYLGAVNLTSPRSVYSQTKRLCEALCASEFQHFGTAAYLARPFNIYGPGQRLNDGRLISDFLSKGFSQTPIELRSDGSPRRSFCYVSDATEAGIRILLYGRKAQAYNVGNDWDEMSIKELASIATEALQLPPYKLIPPPDFQAGSLSRCCPNMSLAHSELGFKAKIGFKKGLEWSWTWLQTKQQN